MIKQRGHHYFINNVHFLNYFDKFCTKTVLAVVRSTTEDSLAQWFVDNYIRKCAELCPDNTFLLCSDLVRSTISDDTVNVVLSWRDHVSNQTLAKQVASLMFCCIAPMGICFRVAPVDMAAIVQDQLFCKISLNLPQVDAPAWRYSLLSVLFDSPDFDCRVYDSQLRMDV